MLNKFQEKKMTKKLSSNMHSERMKRTLPLDNKRKTPVTVISTHLKDI